jgi:hypothetical protein
MGAEFTLFLFILCFLWKSSMGKWIRQEVQRILKDVFVMLSL